MKTLLLLSLAVACFGQSPEHRPKYKKKDITVGAKKITVEIADDDEKRAYGLMYVKKMSKNDGMLFIFDQPEMQSFWMKNTLIPLAIGYFDGKNKLIGVLEMEPASMVEKEIKTYPSTAPAKFALEMNKGWFKTNNIKDGALLKISK